ncbi:MAG: hypothetical protein HOH82_14160 [Planctomycetaceae bacterium]|nr:hypothetical protein [Planctomycetaceae bacterium]
MAMRNHTGHSDLSARLTTLLRRIRDGLDRSLGSLGKAAAGSELPHVHVNDEDVECAVMYLHDVGLKYDGLRLHGGFARLRNRCMDEWFASMADGEPQESRDKLAELYGPFPSQGNPSDLVVADRRVTLLGWAVQLSEFVDELLGTVTASSEMQTGGGGKKVVQIASDEKLNVEKRLRLSELGSAQSPPNEINNPGHNTVNGGGDAPDSQAEENEHTQTLVKLVQKVDELAELTKMKSQPADPASGDPDGLLDTGNGYEKKFYEYDSEVRRCAREFIKARDDGATVTRENHCKEFAGKPKIKKSASTLQKAMTQHRIKWDPDKKYGRPKKKRS